MDNLEFQVELAPQIREPATMITDYLLASLLIFLSWRLFRHYRNFFEPLNLDFSAKIPSLFDDWKQKQWQDAPKKNFRHFHYFWNLRFFQNYSHIMKFHFLAVYFWIRDKFSLKDVEIITVETFSTMPKDLQSSLNVTGRQLSVIFYMLGFLFTAIGAIAGGTSHGFRDFIGETGEIITWQIAVYCLGLTTLFSLCGTIVAHIPTPWQSLLLGFAVIEFALYALWMLFFDNFLYAIIDYSIGAIAIGVIETIQWKNFRESSGRWIVSSIGLTFFAAGLQQVGFGIHEHFNHNDVYHVLQAVAMIMLYLGVRRYKCIAPTLLKDIEHKTR